MEDAPVPIFFIIIAVIVAAWLGWVSFRAMGNATENNKVAQAIAYCVCAILMFMAVIAGAGYLFILVRYPR